MLTSPDLTVDHRLSLSAQILPELEKHGDKVAFIDEVTGRNTTYRELIVTVKRLGAALIKHGLKPGDILSICAPNSMEHVFLFLATARIGAVYHVGQHDQTEALMEHELKICEPTMLVTDHETFRRIKNIIPLITSLKGIFLTGDQPTPAMDTLLSLMTDDEGQDVSDIDADFDAHKVPFTMYYTSGTTDLPKCVVFSHFFHTYGAAKRSNEKWKVLQNGLIMVISKPLYYVSVMAGLMTYFTVGTTLILTADLQPSTLFRAVEMYKVNTLNVSTLQELSYGLGNDYDLSTVHTVMFGGSSARKGEAKALLERLPTLQQIKQYYGMTETGKICSISLNETIMNRMPCGKLAPGCQGKFVRYNSTEELGPNNTGEFYLKTETRMLCYFKEKEKTNIKLSEDGWFRTGDIGYYDEEGYIYIQNRAGDIINHNAGKIFPSEIDNVLLSHPGVVDSATVAVDQPDAGQVPYCFVVPTNKDTVTERMLKQTLHDHLEPAIAADVIIDFLKEMPSLGKEQTKQLQQWAKNLAIRRKI